jgi:uncharacterized protein (DUF4213/DUF364 family)
MAEISVQSSTIQKASTQTVALETAIANASVILTLPSNWDDDGALTVSETVFQSAMQFLRQYIAFIQTKFDTSIAIPNINPVKDGTIDLEWHTAQARMLVNIKPNAIAGYYGDNLNNMNSIKGQVYTYEVQDFLASWMTKLYA